MAQLSAEEPIPDESSSFWVELLEHARRCWDAERENAERLRNKHRLLLTVLAALFGLGLFKIEWLRTTDTLSRVSPFWMIYVIKGFLTAALLVFGWSFVRLRKSSFLIGTPTKFGSAMGLLFVLCGIGLFVVQLRVASVNRSPALVITALLLAVVGALNLVPNKAAVTKKRKRQADRMGRGDGTNPGGKSRFASHHLHFSPELIDAPEATADIIRELIYYRTRRAATDLRDRNIALDEKLRHTQLWFALGIVLIGLAVLCYLWSSCPPL